MRQNIHKNQPTLYYRDQPTRLINQAVLNDENPITQEKGPFPENLSESSRFQAVIQTTALSIQTIQTFLKLQANCLVVFCQPIWKNMRTSNGIISPGFQFHLEKHPEK